jgi:hypothetical protein
MQARTEFEGFEGMTPEKYKTTTDHMTQWINYLWNKGDS